MRFSCAVVLCLAVLSLPASAQSASGKGEASLERPLLYAGHFVRELKQTGARTETFSVPQNSTGPYVLRVTNGSSDGARRVRSARILLNGTEIVSRSQVNAKTEFLWVPVSRLLREQNVLTVIVEGKAGSEMYVTLEDLDAVARAFTSRPTAAASTSASAAGGHQ
ncbi:MAG: hypothetical protein ACRD2Y_05960 [Terriglobales bacterium]